MVVLDRLGNLVLILLDLYLGRNGVLLLFIK